VTKDVARLFVGFGGVERRSAVVEGADVYVEGPGLAGLLPLALSPNMVARLAGTPLRKVFEDGLREFEDGRMLFKDETYRQRIIQAHGNINHSEQVFGE
jgi:hypothetical protein